MKVLQVFKDLTSGNNDVAGHAGFDITTGSQMVVLF